MLNIQGPYLYTDSTVPAGIRIGGYFWILILVKCLNIILIVVICFLKGQPCSISSFTSNSNTGNSTIVCQVPAVGTAQQDYSGNRGITLIEDSGITTSSSNLATAQPSANAQYSEISMASYFASSSGSRTVWLKGFLAPGKTSQYKLSLVTNGVAELYLSTDSTSANKVKIASSSNANALVNLNANTK